MSSIVEHKLIMGILFYSYEYSTFHLELLTTPKLSMIEISFTFSVQALMPNDAELVCGEKSGVSHAEFYKCCMLSIEVSGLILLS